MVSIFFVHIAQAQVKMGVGMTMGLDFYQLYDKGDPEDLVESSTSGNAIANLILGPKVWIGGPRFSVSLEAPLNWGITHFDINEFKGIGALAFPLGAKLNFGAPSGFSNMDLFGFSIGGGIQYMNTEIYGNKKDFKDRIETGYFSTYYGELAFGMGIAGADVSLYVRYGQGEKETRSLNVGLVTNFNFSHLSKVMKEREDSEIQEEVTFIY